MENQEEKDKTLLKVISQLLNLNRLIDSYRRSYNTTL